MIIVNFKNYVLGKKSLALARKIEKINKKIIVAVPTTDIEEISKKTKLKVYAEHIDYNNGPKATGFVIPESVKAVKGKGMLINHSEHKLTMKEIKLTLARCKKLKMETVVCVSKLSDVKKIMKLQPSAIAYEDPNLISTGKSITKYQNKEVHKFASMFKRSKVIPLCGAGISSKEDIKASYDLGCKGVLIASAIARDKKFEILK